MSHPETNKQRWILSTVKKKVEVEIELGLRFNHPTTGLRYVALLRGGFPRPVQWMHCMDRLRYPEQESLQYDPIIS